MISDEIWAHRVFSNDKEIPGFSKRFRKLLSECGFPEDPKLSGEAYQFFGLNRSLIFKGLNRDYCPRDILKMVEKLYNKKLMPPNIAKKPLLLWLVTGDDDPFNDAYEFHVNQRHSETINRVISIINEKARGMSISLSSISIGEVIEMYAIVLSDMRDRDSEVPGSTLVKALLEKQENITEETVT